MIAILNKFRSSLMISRRTMRMAIVGSHCLRSPTLAFRQHAPRRIRSCGGGVRFMSGGDDKHVVPPTVHTKTMHLSDEEIMNKTRDWLDRIVIGWSLCPFSPRQSHDIHMSIVRGQESVDIFAAVLDACFHLQNAEEEKATAIICAPECGTTDFEDYLQHYETIVQDLIDDEMKELIQIAPFHPLFEFQGESTESPATWTNKSPFPLFHVLRQADVTRAVGTLGGDASKVYQRNVDLMDHLSKRLGGGDELEHVVRDRSIMEKHEETIREALKQHRVLMGGSDKGDGKGDAK